MKHRDEYEKKEEARYYKQKDEEILFWIIKIGLYLILLTPLIVKSGVLFPFVSVKTAYFRILVEIISAAYLLLVLQFPRYRPRLSLISISVSLFVIVIILTALTGVNIHNSMWSTYERMGGLFTHLHLWAFFIILTGIIKEEKEWKGILTASVIVATIASIYAFLASEASKGGGTMGNTSFLAAYLLFNIFISGMLFAKEKKMIWRIFYGMTLVIILPKFLTSSARAAIISFFIGLFFLAIFYCFNFFRIKGRKYVLFFIIFLIITGVISGFLLRSYIEEIVKYVFSISTIKARILIWKMAWSGWKEKFLLGWGSENFRAPFNKYFDSRLFYKEYGSEVWFDRTHNKILGVGINSGIFGVFSYFFIFIGSFFVLWKKYFLTKKNFTIALFLSVILISYFIQNLTVFDMISTSLMFFLTLACIDFYGRFYPADNFQSWTVKKISIRPILTVFIGVFTVFIVFKGNIQPLIASSLVQEAPDYLYQGKFNDFLDIYKKNVSNIWWGKSEIRGNLIRTITQYFRSGSAKNMEISEELYQNLLFVSGELEDNVKKNPLDLRAYLFLDDIYNILSKVDKKYIALAEKNLIESAKLSPGNLQVYQRLGQNMLLAGYYDEAISYYEYSVSLAPELGASYWYLSQAYKIVKMPDLGLRAAYKAIELGYPDEEVNSFAHIGDLYAQAGDIANAISVYERAVERYPENTQFHISLAVIYKNMGDIERAVAEAEKVSELNPNFATSSRDFIKSLIGDKGIDIKNFTTSSGAKIDAGY